MLSHRDILRDVRRALKELPDNPSACEVTRVPGAGTQTIVVRDASGRPLLTVSALAAVWAPVIPGRHQQTLDAVAPRPELPEVPPLAVDPMAPGVRVLRVGDAVFARDGAPWVVKAIVGDEVRLACDARVSVIAVQRETIILGETDLWYCADLPAREPRQIADTVRLWIPEGVWDGLSGDARDDLEEPLGGVRVDWQGTAGWVWARVARDEVLVTLRGLAEAHGVEIVEGEETPASPAAEPATPAVTTLRVPRGPWLLHRSELRDTAKAPLHKQWLPVGEDCVTTVPRGSELVGIIRAFCVAQKVPLWIDDVQVSPSTVEAAPVKAKRSKKGGAA